MTDELVRRLRSIDVNDRDTAEEAATAIESLQAQLDLAKRDRDVATGTLSRVRDAKIAAEAQLAQVTRERDDLQKREARMRADVMEHCDQLRALARAALKESP